MKKIALLALVLLFAASTVPSAAFAESNGQGNAFGRSLVRGMSGDDVKDLQKLLSEDREVFPEGLVTGFFGSLTENAVKKFQKKHGIEQVGAFGPKSRAKLLGLFDGRNLPPGLSKKFEDSVSTSSRKNESNNANEASNSGKEKATICHIPPGNLGNKQTLIVGESAVKAHLAHGDKRGNCDGTSSTPDTVKPLIQNISLSNISSTSASVNWITNEPTKNTVWFATSTPVVLASPTLSVGTTTLGTNHLMTLSSLTASTTYFFVIESKDAANNTSTSSPISFITLP